MSQPSDLTALTAFLRKHFSGIEARSLTEDGTLMVEITGPCASCPMQDPNLEEDIMELIEGVFPDVKQIQVGPSVSDETMALVHKILRGDV